jgi:3-oxoadipate enol-lactonase
MTRRIAAADGAGLAAERHGRTGASAVLFLNSIGCDRRLWAAQVAELSRDFHCLTFDARGHGKSDAPAGEYQIAQLGGDALAVLDAAGAERAHLCGLSLGGLVAQWLATHAPERVASVTLANTAGRIGTPQVWEDRRRLVLAEGLAAIADTAMERFFSAAFRAERPAVVAEMRDRLLASPAVGYAGCCAALRDADLTADLACMTAPALVIGGADDVSTPPDQAAALADAVPGAKLVMLDAAHLSNLEQPDAFNRALRAHLESL